jgi:hypothetical protein
VLCNSCLPSVKKHSANSLFAKYKKNTQQTASLPSVKKTLVEFFLTISKEPVCQVFFFTECFFCTRQKLICRVPEKLHSAKKLALGKQGLSGTVKEGRCHGRNR